MVRWEGASGCAGVCARWCAGRVRWEIALEGCAGMSALGCAQSGGAPGCAQSGGAPGARREQGPGVGAWRGAPGAGNGSGRLEARAVAATAVDGVDSVPVGTSGSARSIFPTLWVGNFPLDSSARRECDRSYRIGGGSRSRDSGSREWDVLDVRGPAWRDAPGGASRQLAPPVRGAPAAAPGPPTVHDRARQRTAEPGAHRRARGARQSPTAHDSPTARRRARGARQPAGLTPR